MKSSHPLRISVKRRRATVLIAALVCLSIVMALVGCMLLAAMQTGRQLHVERDRRQCELLLAAGVMRASHASNTANYRGEKWRIPDEQIIGKSAGEVTIAILPDSVNEKRQLLVVAEYPLSGETSIRRSQTILVPFTRPAGQE
jgi:type IV secretory pathway VirB3-like protein